MYRPRTAFSLVELSIVLVILGLLVGGILAGQSLIRASELRAVSAEYDRFNAATNAFRDKYFAIPGDISNATSFWGDDAVACADPLVADGTPGTCNGNGNGRIGTAAAGATSEEYQFWKHLALAGLIEGTFSGINGPGSSEHTVPGTNAPFSRLSGGAWSVANSILVAGDPDLYANISFQNYFEFGKPVNNSRTFGKLLKPEEAWNIDTKIDDGKPAYGKVIARYWNNLCAVADSYPTNNVKTNLDASYKLSDSGTQCALYFIRAF